MTDPNERLHREVARRRTFAIISHPDAGKTTLTEKLLLYGGAIHLAGSVKQRRRERATTSDWMAMERERGISISTSVLQFSYRDHHMNLLDTPGHNDFSEDTYRTLAAADCAVMLVDSGKGVEAQTIKLFEVCRMRKIPIVTFINKMDRDGNDPLDLMDEIERILGIPCSPINWPVGAGKRFQGVFDRQRRELMRFVESDYGARKAKSALISLGDPTFVETIGETAHKQLLSELELLDVAGNAFDIGRFREGAITPVFFGSAMNNFGVEPFLDRFVDFAPSPLPRTTEGGVIDPMSSEFTAFVFKIQANMDQKHRDRIAFTRICSGRFERGMAVKHVRTGRTLTLNRSLQFLAQERTEIEEAFAGDILGLWDAGVLRIGDTLTQDSSAEFDGIPRFSPEHFMRARLPDSLKRKQLKKGLDQLSEEGAVQVFFDPKTLERDPILGAVGVLQFEVVAHRLKAEYGVTVVFESLPYNHARWIAGAGAGASFDASLFEQKAYGRTKCLVDVEDRPLVLFGDEWSMRRTTEEHPELEFIAAVQPGRTTRAV
ncbi:MAG TPA: peptide chain release factor 3 [Polyangiaceae bacterium]|nr:peptide chain release factor 3 [Polyangiaceae bacterium]